MSADSEDSAKDSTSKPIDERPIGAYVPERVPEVAAGMLARYSTARVAREMACHHATDFRDETPGRRFWTMVRDEIDRQSKGASR